MRSEATRSTWSGTVDKLRLLSAAANGNELERLRVWLGDCLIACGRFDEAIEAMPTPDFLQRWSTLSSKVLAVKLLTGGVILPIDIIGLFGPNFTKFGRDNVTAIAEYIQIQLKTIQRDRSLLREWSSDAHEIVGGMPLFSGHNSYFVVKPPRGLCFDRSAQAQIFCSKLIKDAENSWREEQGIPRIGEGWVSETELYYKIKAALPTLAVAQHASPDWLGRQHLDIFIPELGVAVEYQGAQHDRPIAYFGGEQAFKQTQTRDARKRQLCKENGIRLLYAREGYVFADLLAELTAAIS